MSQYNRNGPGNGPGNVCRRVGEESGFEVHCRIAAVNWSQGFLLPTNGEAAAARPITPRSLHLNEGSAIDRGIHKTVLKMAVKMFYYVLFRFSNVFQPSLFEFQHVQHVSTVFQTAPMHQALRSAALWQALR